MRVTIAKNLLSTAIARVQGAVAEKSVGQIGLKASGHQLKLMAADRAIAIFCDLDCLVHEEGEAFVPAKDCLVHEEGEAFVPAKFFADVAKELPAGEVMLAVSGAWMTITAGKQAECILKLPVKEDAVWREAPTLTSQSNHALLPSTKISYMVEQVQFCVAQDSPRSYGAVGYLHKADETSLRLVGTDGFRLSYCDVNLAFPADFLPAGVCISKRGLGELMRMCHEGFEQIKLTIADDLSSLCAEVAGYQIYILLSAVKYPHYQGVLPQKQAAQVELPRQTLQGVAKRVLLAADKSKALQLSFSPQALTLSTKNMGNSEGRETMSLPGYEGPECRLAVNGKYLADIFATTTSDDLQIHFSNHEDPVVLVPSQEPKGCLSRHILVPIREGE